MVRFNTLLNSVLLGSMLFSCGNLKSEQGKKNETAAVKKDTSQANLLTDYVPLHEDGHVNAVIEIPAGTWQKWELNKSTGQIEWQMIDDKPRIINYLGYPGNYGMIPRTLLSKELGGDGDPLDVLVLGPPAMRGQVIKCKIIGVLYLLDNGEQDDKLIAVSSDSPLYHVNSLEELNINYNGISEILELWFSNYKGVGIMKSKGFGDVNSAMEILNAAIYEYNSNKTE